jgi:hypothetical protein
VKSLHSRLLLGCVSDVWTAFLGSACLLFCCCRRGFDASIHSLNRSPWKPQMCHLLKSAPFWNFTQSRMVDSYGQPIGPRGNTCRVHVMLETRAGTRASLRVAFPLL